MEKKFNLFLICFIINIIFSTQDPLNFDVEINPNTSTTKTGFFINDRTSKSYCEKWFPSLFLPILLIPNKIEVDSIPDTDLDFLLKIPFFNKNKGIPIFMFKPVIFLENNFQSLLMKSDNNELNNCYLGVGHGVRNYSTLEKNDTILSFFESQSLKKIFSFSKWNLNPPISTIFYLGESHKDFNSNKGIIGKCKNYPEDDLWGCSFKEMIINNINIPLNNSDGNIYKIYIATETHNLIFPKAYTEIFNTISDGLCNVQKENYLSCQGFFNNSTYVKLQLTESDENFIITGQVDSVNRFSLENPSQKDFARIQFENIDYIILPLMAFKDFHVQFNAEDDEISFYTEDPNILKVKEEVKKDPSSGSSAFIIILIILIIIGIGLGVFWFLRKRKSNEKNINQFSKFEDEEDYKNMNEKKVF